MDECVKLLTTATTAIRDLQAGYRDEDIIAPSGRGVNALLRDLVTYLRGNGVDDEGAWDCDATEGIKVKREQAFEPFKLVVEAYAIDEYGEGPSWAEVTVTPEFLQTLKRLRRVCQDENLESLTIPQGPDRWDREDDLRIRGDSLRVWRDSFWFEAHPKHRDYSVETQSILIDHLIRVTRKIASSDTENQLPDGFAIVNGAIFYSDDDPQDLASNFWEAGDVCSECGSHTDGIIGCPDGAEVCQACFDNGAR